MDRVKSWDDFVGRTVASVWLDGEKTWLRFVFTDAKVADLQCHGECCSYSWIEHVNGIRCLIGKVIHKAVEREIPNISDECLCYGWTLETSCGRFDIEMRNASNGYYGGSLDFLSDAPKVPELHLVSADF